jgi:1-phosphofructokinase family hexose kinase
VIVVGGFNPALDKLADTEAIEPGAVLRLSNVRVLPGGKGLHAALACVTLEAPVTLVGPIDDPNRESFARILTAAGGRFIGVPIADPIRTCLAIRDRAGRTTELLEPGPVLGPDAASRLLSTFRREAAAARLVVLSGSLPPGLGDDTYARVMQDVGPARVMVDTSGAALARAVAERPLAVKPNRHEAEQLVGFPVRTARDAARAAAAIGARGASMVLLSIGAQGAVAWSHERCLHVTAPHVEVRNTVGAGDCLLAGFAAALLDERPFDECARFAVACGTAKVQHPETGLLRRADVLELLPAVTATAIEA